MHEYLHDNSLKRSSRNSRTAYITKPLSLLFCGNISCTAADSHLFISDIIAFHYRSASRIDARAFPTRHNGPFKSNTFDGCKSYMSLMRSDNKSFLTSDQDHVCWRLESVVWRFVILQVAETYVQVIMSSARVCWASWLHSIFLNQQSKHMWQQVDDYVHDPTAISILATCTPNLSFPRQSHRQSPALSTRGLSSLRKNLLVSLQHATVVFQPADTSETPHLKLFRQHKIWQNAISAAPSWTRMMYPHKSHSPSPFTQSIFQSQRVQRPSADKTSTASTA